MNNNPLEYWTTYDSPGYMQLMVDVERMIDNPGDRDVPLGTIFPAFEDLTTRMAAVEGLNNKTIGESDKEIFAGRAQKKEERGQKSEKVAEGGNAGGGGADAGGLARA